VTHRESSLLSHLLLFSKGLREKKVGVTTDNVIDALRGIPFIDLRKKSDFYQLLKSNFVSKKEEIAPFDDLFEAFWSFENKATLFPEILRPEEGGTSQESEEAGSALLSKRIEISFGDSGEEETEGREADLKETLRYSAEEILTQKEFGHLETGELEKVKEFVLALTRRMAIRLSRRWERGRKGDRLDLRKVLRKSLKYGGEILELPAKEPKTKPLRLIFICDVSGSMDIYSQFFLLFMYGLQHYYAHCETFVFSTRLSQATIFLKRKDFDEALRLLSTRALDWSGGTNIGLSLHQFRQQHSHLLSPQRTILIIFSDGWDRGDTTLLDSEIRSLKKQVKKVIWLNPLSGSPNYQPLCRGMAAALPYLDHFLPCHSFSSLKSLDHLMSE
jgi:uncharacterized protein with von Willebrand factor type A (vWA) domain